MNYFYLTIDGIKNSEDEQFPMLELAHVLQRYRDVWIVIPKPPYLAIDADRVKAHANGLEEFPVILATGILVQNMNPKDVIRRIFARTFVGPGVTAEFASNSDVVVEGCANPQTNNIWSLNSLLMVGTHPFSANGERYIYVTPNDKYQRTFAQSFKYKGTMRFKSMYADFEPLSNKVDTLWKEYLSQPDIKRAELHSISNLLDSIFCENEKILAAVKNHHFGNFKEAPKYDYKEPSLTKYERLNHQDGGEEPYVEVSFCLLHYETALREFNDLKGAVQKQDPDAIFRHGVYCVVAAAAFVEAFGNLLVFQATGDHPDPQDKRTPLKKINAAATILSELRGGTYTGVGQKTLLYESLDRVRKNRNDFMHAKERGVKVDCTSGTSSMRSVISEQACRSYLKSIRDIVSKIHKEIPGWTPPIVIDTRVKWVSDMEVP